MPEKEFHGLLDAHVPLATCKPRELWKLERISAAGHTSEWDKVKRHSQFLSELLEITGGRIPYQKSMTPLLDSWLRGNGMVWALTDTERATLHLRVMLMSLVPYRREPSKRLPFKQQCLQLLVDKLHMSDDEGNSDAEASPRDRKNSAVSAKQLAAHTLDEPLVVLPPQSKNVLLLTISDPPSPTPMPDISMDDLDNLESKLFGNASSSNRVEPSTHTDCQERHSMGVPLRGRQGGGRGGSSALFPGLFLC